MICIKLSPIIALNSPFYAKITVDKLKNTSQILKKFPTIGRIVLEFEDEKISEIIIGNYRIIYHNFSENEIWILSIIHSARDLPNIPIQKPNEI